MVKPVSVSGPCLIAGPTLGRKLADLCRVIGLTFDSSEAKDVIWRWRKVVRGMSASGRKPLVEDDHKLGTRGNDADDQRSKGPVSDKEVVPRVFGPIRCVG